MKEDHKFAATSIPNLQHLYTEKQGQYLSFIYYYSKINRKPPAESDMQRFFAVSAPSVHRMLVDLERKRLIEKEPGSSRSVRVLLPTHLIPELLS